MKIQNFLMFLYKDNVPRNSVFQNSKRLANNVTDMGHSDPEGERKFVMSLHCTQRKENQADQIMEFIIQ